MPYLFCLFLLLLTIPASAQLPVYLHYGIEEGLPSNLVYCAEQDKEGYIWFGTDKGLSRFDGERFKNYGVRDGLPDPEVLHLYADRKSRLWIGCFHQKPAYRTGGQFHTASTDTNLQQMSFRYQNYDFYEDSDSTLWITSGNIIGLDSRNLSKKPWGRNVHLGVIWARKMNDTWLGFGGRPIYRLDFQSDTINRTLLYQHSQGHAWSPTIVMNGTRILLLFEDRTVLLELRQGKIIELAETNQVFRSGFTDSHGRFWACAPGKGAFCFDNNRKDLSNPKIFLPGKKVQRMYEDRQGDFWLLTSGQGIYKLLKQYSECWNNNNGLLSNNIVSITKTGNGTILAGDDNGNLYHFDAGKLTGITTFGAKDGNNLIRQAHSISPNELWIVSDEGFFYRKNRHITNFEYRPERRLFGGGSKAMLPVKKGFWCGTSSELFFLDAQTHQPSQITRGRVTCLATDDEGWVWKGGSGGLFSQKDQFFQNWGDVFPELKKRIVAIQPDGPNRLWVISSDGRLLQVGVRAAAVQAVTDVTWRLKKRIDNIKNIYSAADGTLWLSTSQGIYGLDRQWNIIHLTLDDGLVGEEVNSVVVSEDTLWAATSSGISRLKIPAQNSNSFQTRLSVFYYQLQDSMVTLDFSGKSHLPLCIVLPAEARLPSADFVGLNQEQNSRLQYEHVQQTALLPFPSWTFGNLIACLGSALGLDSGSDTFVRNEASIKWGTQMPSGRYVFKSTALTINEIRSESPVVWELIMLPNWTEQIWIWLLITGILVLGLWHFYHLRIQNLTLESSNARQQLTALRAQMNPHFVGNSINAIQQFFYPPDPAKASEYIYLFNALLRKTLHLSEKDFIAVSEECAYIQGYLEMIRLRYADRFYYELEMAQDIPAQAGFPSMILQPIIENATIHGLAPVGMSHLVLSFSMVQDRIVASISDNGIGIDKSLAQKKSDGAQRESKGLQILQNKVSILNQLYHIDLQIDWSDTGHGTLVLVSYQTLSNCASK